MMAVFKREFRDYTHNVVGWLFMAVLLLFVSLMSAYYNFLSGSTDITPALSFGEYVMILMAPILCMRSMTEDRRNKTDMFYLSLPIKTSAVVLGKYLALLAIFAIPVGILGLYPLIFSLYGDVNFLASYAFLFTFFLMGAGILALCMFISSMTEHLVVSAVAGIGVLILLYLLPIAGSMLPTSALASYIGFAVLVLVLAGVAYLTTRSLPVSLVMAAVLILILSVLYICWPSALADTFPTFAVSVSPFAQFEYMALYGLFDIHSIAVFASYVVLFLFLTVQKADRKRYL
jgi:ABC-2 type transport system permease protein